ncbi:MAG TPA: hypothetical protein VH186_31660 [Chloroflexia bacterium]|nr:hypothetical protein [Chloroflexia bacterium]
MKYVLKQRFLLTLAVSLMLIMMAVVMAGPMVADAATPAQLYIRAISTEPYTSVGQQPKVVATYGNTGGTAVDVYDAYCYYTTATQSVYSTRIIFTKQTLIPGQNANMEYDFYAYRTGTTGVRCVVDGFEAGTGRFLAMTSNEVTITVR